MYKYVVNSLRLSDTCMDHYSNDGMLPVLGQAISWNNADLLSAYCQVYFQISLTFVPKKLKTNVGEIWMKMQYHNTFENDIAKWEPFCLGFIDLYVVMHFQIITKSLFSYRICNEH